MTHMQTVNTALIEVSYAVQPTEQIVEILAPLNDGFVHHSKSACCRNLAISSVTRSCATRR